MTIEKTYGVRGVANDLTMIRIQEVIALTKKQYGWVGKAVIDTEKIMFLKFGLKLGLLRHSTNGFVVDEDGIIRYAGFIRPAVYDHQILKDLYRLFGMTCPIRC